MGGRILAGEWLALWLVLQPWRRSSRVGAHVGLKVCSSIRHPLVRQTDLVVLERPNQTRQLRF